MANRQGCNEGDIKKRRVKLNKEGKKALYMIANSGSKRDRK